MALFTNFTEESCSGTGDVITLLGPTINNIAFSSGYTNGDSVPYALEDALGVVKIIGVGVYSAGTITRSDTWNYNGAVTDSSPVSNITLNAGQHIIRVASVASDMDSWNSAFSWGDHALVGYSTTDTVYDDTTLAAAVALNTAKVTNVDHPLVETAVPVGAVFTDTVYDSTAIDAAVALNTAKVSNVDHPLVETAVPIGAVFTDTNTTYTVGNGGLTEINFTSADNTKLDGIAAGAEVNTVDSVAGKTGIVTLTKADVGLGNVSNTSDANKPVSTAQQTALDLKLDDTQLNAANGIAPLGADSKVPMANLPASVVGAMSYAGVWNASTNTPNLTAVGSLGVYYKVSVAGATSLSGITDWNIGDWVVSNGTSWDQIDNTDSVSSVAGKTGAVTLVKADVGLSNVTNTSDANKPVSTATQTALDLKVDDTQVLTNVPAGAVFTDTVTDKGILELASTGIRYGGLITINTDTSKFDVSAGAGWFINHSDTLPTTLTEVTWPAFTAQTLTNLVSSFATDVAIDINGNLLQQDSFSDLELRSLVLLGGIDHSNQTSIVKTFPIQRPTKSVASNVSELARAVGDINLSGNNYAANGANLSLDKSGGLVYSYGRNNGVDSDNPSKITTASLTAFEFGYVFDNTFGAGTFLPPTAFMDPNNYDNGAGAVAAVGNNKFTIQRILYFANANSTFLQYGNAVYNTLTDALDAVPRAGFATFAGIRTAMVRGYIVIKQGTTDLSSADVKFLAADKFGNVAGLEAGSTTASWGNITGTLSLQTDLQTALDGKVDDAQVLTNVPAGAVFTDTTYSVGNGGLTQINFTSADNTKLDGIATSANNYSHPANHPPSIITQDINNRFVTDAEKATWNSHTGDQDLSSYTLIGHTHTIANITGLQTALNGKVDDSQVLTNVPAGAVFTDTTYSVGDGGLTEINFTSADNTKLDGIALNANNYALPRATGTVRGGVELFTNVDNTVAANAASSVANRTYGIQLNASDQMVVNVPWVDTNTNTTYSVGDGGLSEINFTSADHTKLNGIATSANNYSLPEATATVRGGIELFSNTDNPTAANGVTSTGGRTYGIQLNSSGQAVVNVPWVDTNTNTVYTHPANHPPSIITQDASNRFVTDSEKTLWNSHTGDQDLSGYFPISGGTVLGNLFVNNSTAAATDVISSAVGSYPALVTEMYARGTQRWNVGSESGVFIGSIQLSTPFGQAGISLRDVNELGRTDLRLLGTGGGISLGTIAGNTVPPTQLQIGVDNNVQVTLGDLSVPAGNITALNLSGTNTGDQTAAEILTALKTVDVNGTAGVNAGTFDGLGSGSFLRSDAADSYQFGKVLSFHSNVSMNTATGSQASLEVRNTTIGNDAFMQFHVSGDYAIYFGLDGGTNKLSVGGWSMGANSYEIYHAGNLPSLSTLGYTGATNANNYTHPTYTGDDFSIDTGALTGATVISDIDINVTTDTSGHVTDANATVATRTLTAADIGASDTSHGHSFDSLTGKTSGTGDYSTSSSVIAGRGSGSVSLNANDGYGNANVAFNHHTGIPDVTGSSARIETSVDSGTANMYFELKDNTVAGVAVALEGIMALSTGRILSQKNHDFSLGIDVTGNITVTGTVDGRDVALDGTKLDGIETNATSDQTAAEILSLLKTVDVDGTAGVNAGTLAGQLPSTSQSANTIVQRNASGYIFSQYYNGTGTFSTNGASSGMAIFTGTNGTDNYGRSYNAAAARILLNVENGATADQTAAEILASLKTVDVNGTAGVNAGTFDGVVSTSFLRSDTSDTWVGTQTGSTLYVGGSQIVGSAAVLQVNGFQRTGDIYLHEMVPASNDVNPTPAPGVLSNELGVLSWNDLAVYHSGNVPTWNQSTTGNAGTVTNGVYTSGDQSISGIKTFTAELYLNGAINGYINNTAGALYLRNQATQSHLYIGVRNGDGSNNLPIRCIAGTVLTNSYVQLFYGTTESVRVTNTGANFYGPTTSSWITLSANGTHGYFTNNTGHFYIRNQAHGSDIYFSVETDDGNGDTPIAVIAGATNGTSYPQLKYGDVVKLHTKSLGVYITGDLEVSGKMLFAAYNRGLHMLDSTWIRTTDTTAKIYVSNTAADAVLVEGGVTARGSMNALGYARNSAHTGHLVGSYTNIGVNSSNSNPIYTIGSAYNPASTTLGNMYGIGYTSASSSTFINSTDLGVTPAGWGMYVASDGNARVFLNGQNGNACFKGNVYASQGVFRGALSTTDIDCTSVTFPLGAKFLDETIQRIAMRSGNLTGGAIVFEDSAGAIKGYDYWDSGGYGLLSSAGQWGVRLNPGTTELMVNSVTRLTATTSGVNVVGVLSTTGTCDAASFYATTTHSNSTTAAGDLRIGGNGILGNQTTLYVSNTGGAVALNHLGLNGVNTKLFTSSTGVTVIGDATCTTFRGENFVSSGGYGFFQNNSSTLATLYGDQQGTGKIAIWRQAGVERSYINNAGDFIPPASSIRYKTILSRDYDTLSKVVAIGSKGLPHFVYKNSPVKERIGGIAEDIVQFFPQVIEYTESGQIHAVDYTSLIMPTYTAISQLNDKVEAQEVQIEEQQTLIATLITRLDALESI